MDGKLLSYSTDELLRKFGAGNHKPGSGSAAALQGMLSAQLIRTVINLTADPKRNSNYKTWLAQLKKIDSEIESRIYPELRRLFQDDSVQFDKVIKLREARDGETTDPARKRQLAVQALQAQMPATETPVEIAKLCIELADFAALTFDHGFQSARGDSSVALNASVAAIAGCLSIIDLNLLSFGNDEWTEKIRSEADQLRSVYKNLSQKTTDRLGVLKDVADRNKAYHLEIRDFRSGKWEKVKLSNSDIEEIAKQLQNTLWKYRDKIWKHTPPESLIDVLKPEVGLTKILGYQFRKLDALGQHEVNGEVFEIAGLIDKLGKHVTISKRFSPETQYFTAAHELGHALLHEQTMFHRDRAMDGSSITSPREPEEQQADKFSAYFLMPRKPVKSIFLELFQTKKFILNENTAFALNQGRVNTLRTKCQDLHGLARVLASAEYYNGKVFNSMARVFRVSVEAMAIRLEELELLEF